MAQNSIGSAALILSTNNAGLDKGLKTAKEEILAFSADISGNLKVMGTGMWGGVIAGARLAINAIKASFAHIDDIRDMGEMLGITTEKFSTLRFAAVSAGMDMEKFNKGMKNFAEHLSDVRTSGEETAGAFERIGISQADLASKPIDQIFERVSTALADISDPIDRTTMAMELFGKKGIGPDFIQLLNKGGAGIHALREEAIKLGVDLNSADADKVEEAASKWRQLKEAASSMVDKVTVALGPAIDQIAISFKTVAKNIQFWLGGISDFFGSIKTGIMNFAATVLDTLASIDEAFLKLPKWMQGSYHAGTKEEAENLRRYAAALREVAKQDFFPAAAKPADKKPGLMDEGLEKVIKSGKELEFKMKDEMKTFGLSGEAAEAYKLKLKGLSEVTYTYIMNLNAQKEAMTKAMSLVEDTPLQKYQQELEGLQLLLESGAISWDKYAAGVAKASAHIIETSGIDKHLGAEAAMAGSKQAVDRVLEHRIKAGHQSPADKLHQAIEEQKNLQRISNDYQKQILDAVKDQKLNLGTI